MDEYEIRIGQVESPLLTSKEAAEYLGLTKGQLARLRRRGKLEFVNLPGGTKRYFRRTVEHYGKTLETRREPTES